MDKPEMFGINVHQVEAIQYQGENLINVVEFCRKAQFVKVTSRYDGLLRQNMSVEVNGAQAPVRINDWVVKLSETAYIVLNPETFEEIFRKVPDNG